MNQVRGAELAAELAVLHKPSDQAAERPVELGRGTGHAIAFNERDGEHVGLELRRRDRLHLDSHRVAMLADAPRTLRSACSGYTFGAFVPIAGAWRAAQH